MTMQSSAEKKRHLLRVLNTALNTGETMDLGGLSAQSQPDRQIWAGQTVPDVRVVRRARQPYIKETPYTLADVDVLVRDVQDAIVRSFGWDTENPEQAATALAAALGAEGDTFASITANGAEIILSGLVDRLSVVDDQPVIDLVDTDGATASGNMILDDYALDLDRNPTLMTSGRRLEHATEEMLRAGLIGPGTYNLLTNQGDPVVNAQLFRQEHPDWYDALTPQGQSLDMERLEDGLMGFWEQLGESVELYSRVPSGDGYQPFESAFGSELKNTVEAMGEGLIPLEEVSLPLPGLSPLDSEQLRDDREFAAYYLSGDNPAEAGQRWLENTFGRPGQDVPGEDGSVQRALAEDAYKAARDIATDYAVNHGVSVGDDVIAQQAWRILQSMVRGAADSPVEMDPNRSPLEARYPGYYQFKQQKLDMEARQKTQDDLEKARARYTGLDRVKNALRDVGDALASGFMDAEGQWQELDVSDEVKGALANKFLEVLDSNPGADPAVLMRMLVTDNAAELNRLGHHDITENMAEVVKVLQEHGLDTTGMKPVDFHSVAVAMQGTDMGAEEIFALAHPVYVQNQIAMAEATEQGLVENPGRLSGIIQNAAGVAGVSLTPDTLDAMAGRARMLMESHEGPQPFDVFGWARGVFGDREVAGTLDRYAREAEFAGRFSTGPGRTALSTEILRSLGHVGADAAELAPGIARQLQFTDPTGLAGLDELLELDAIALPLPAQPDVVGPHVSPPALPPAAYAAGPGQSVPAGTPQHPAIRAELSSLLGDLSAGVQLSGQQIDRLDDLSAHPSLSERDRAQIGEALDLQRAPIPGASRLFAEAAGDDVGFLRYLVGQREGLHRRYSRIPETTTTFDRAGMQSIIDKSQREIDMVAHPAAERAIGPASPTALAIVDPAQRSSLSRAFTTTTQRLSFDDWFAGELPKLREEYSYTPAGVAASQSGRMSDDRVSRARPVTLYRSRR